MALVFGSISTDILALFAILSATLYFYVTLHKYSYWKRLGVKQISPTFPFGNFAAAFLQIDHIGLYLQDVYKKTKEPFIGLYSGFKPMLLVNDPELIRLVFIKDFQNFQDRGMYIDEERDPLSGHLFSMNGEKWRNLRNKLSPTFTSGKLKAMFPTLVECGDSLLKFVDKYAEKGQTLEVRDILARYTTNIIASVAFGIDIDCITNENESFRKYGKKVFEPSFGNALRGLTAFIFPKLMPILNLKGVSQDVEDFILSMTRQSLEYREKNNITRKDFLQLMVQLRNTGAVQSDGVWETKIIHDESKKTLSVGEVAAQSFVFLIAGFETSSTTMSYCLYELARNPEYQKRVQQEIADVLAKHNGEITYESVSEMHLLENCIDETLRMYPPLLILNRECTKDWKIPGTDTTIRKGVQVAIPAFALQRDEKYYPNPNQFVPERFNAENSAGKSFVDRPYMPFGEGPRLCIGMRLGKMQSKVGLVLMLKNYNFDLTGSTLKPLVINPSSFVISPVGGLPLKITKR